MRGEIKEINLYVIKRRGWAVQCSVIIYFYLVTKPLFISKAPYVYPSTAFSENMIFSVLHGDGYFLKGWLHEVHLTN